MLLYALVLMLIIVGSGLFVGAKVSAAYMGTRFLKMSDSKAGATNVTYDVSFTTATAGTIGSIQIQFCSNSTLISDPCTAPVGLDASAATLSAQSGLTGFSISAATTANNIVLSRTASAAGVVTAEFTFDGMTNPATAGSYFVRVNTFASTDTSGPITDHGGMAIAINPAFNLNVTVPPYLLFCVGITISGTDCSTVAGDFIDMGNFSTSKTSSGQSQMVVATNGKTGYGIRVIGTTMESGNNTIPAMNPVAPSTTGVSQFGINLRANSNPSVGQNPVGPGIGTPTANYNIPNQFYYFDGDNNSNNNVVASAPSPEDLHKFTVSYIVNVGQNQAVGIYASTFTYVATAKF